MEDASQLNRLGYDQFFDDSRVKMGGAIEQTARVTAEHRGAYTITGVEGEYRATVTGRRVLSAKGRDDYPAVGDWVIIKEDESKAKIIVDILPRKTAIHKKYGGRDDTQLIATNVDVVFIVESINRDYSLNRFERYLVLVRESGAKPVIIINKSDLATPQDITTIINDLRERFDGIDVLITSTVTDAGLDELTRSIQSGMTYCFLGSSGAGKSSLINTLLRHNITETKAIGENTQRGRHTTTTRQLYCMDGGGIIIDNPGSREVGVVESTAGIEEVFADIKTIAHTCKFSDCTHKHEFGCAVRQALEAGVIDAPRYENYQRLQKETEFHTLNAYGKRRKDKKFGKFIKNAKTKLRRFDIE